MSGFSVEFVGDDRPPLDVDADWHEEDGAYTVFFKSGRRLDQITRDERAAIPTSCIRAIVRSTQNPGDDT